MVLNCQLTKHRQTFFVNRSSYCVYLTTKQRTLEGVLFWEKLQAIEQKLYKKEHNGRCFCREFCEISNRFMFRTQSNIFAETRSVVDVRLGSKYVSTSVQLLGKATRIYFREVTEIFLLFDCHKRNQGNLKFETSIFLQKCQKHFFILGIYFRNRVIYFEAIVFTDMR